jgi:Rrf2 family protein
VATAGALYALQAVVDIAARAAKDPVPSHAVARGRGVSQRFLLKVLKDLAKAGVLRSAKGPNGGYQLARPAADITLYEILVAVDGPPLCEAPSVTVDRATAEVLNGVSRAMASDFDQLKSVSLADLVKPSRGKRQG